MNREKFFNQLKEELKGNDFYKKRFLEELEAHAEDLENDKELKEKFIESEMIKKYLGEPKEISKTFRMIMNPWDKVLTLTLYSFSFYSLYVAWGFMINTLLVPWDTSLDRPPIGSLTRAINDFFESGLGSFLIPILLTGISLLTLILRIKKEGRNSAYRILDYAAISNFFYLSLMILISTVYGLIKPISEETQYNPIAMVLHLIGIITLFYMQYTGFILKKKLSNE